MKILVTGSNGTIGTRLCEQLLEKGQEVSGLDIKANEWQESVDKITAKADLRQPGAFAKAPADADMLVHLAANAMVNPSVENPQLAMDNMQTVFNALEFARKKDIKRFIFASSREVYGNTEQPLHREEDADVEKAESPYSATKLAGEAMVRAYHACYGIDFIIIRYSNVYGMYDNSHRLIPASIRRAARGEPLQVYGRDKLLDFTYIDDSVAGTMLAMEKFRTARNEAYNIAYGRGSTIIEVVEQINRLLGNKSRVVVTEPRAGEVIKYIADISKARERLGYEPKVALEQGIKRAIDWFRQRGLI